jgi:hypothetical protein
MKLKTVTPEMAQEIRAGRFSYMHGWVFVCGPLPLAIEPDGKRDVKRGMPVIMSAWIARPQGPNPEIIALVHQSLN